MINPPKFNKLSDLCKVHMHFNGELVNLIDATGQKLGLYDVNFSELVRKICQRAILLNAERNLYKEKLSEVLKEYNEYLSQTNPKNQP